MALIRILNLISGIFFNIKSLLKIAIYKYIGYQKLENLDTNMTPEMADKLLPIFNHIELSTNQTPFYSILYSLVLFVFVASLLI